jgi:hypothetical protein
LQKNEAAKGGISGKVTGFVILSGAGDNRFLELSREKAGSASCAIFTVPQGGSLRMSQIVV